MDNKIRYRDIPIFLLFCFIPVEIEIIPQFSTVKLVTILVIIVYLINIKTYVHIRDKMSEWHIKLCLMAILSCIWSIDTGASLSKAVMFLVPTVITCWIVYQTIDSVKKVNIALFMYFIGCMINVVYSLINRNAILLAAEFAGQDRMVAFGQDPNMLAFLLNMGIVSAYYIYTTINMNKLLKLLLLVCTSLMLYISISTGSRTGLITICLCVAIICFNGARNVAKMIPLTIIAFILILKYLPESIIERFMDTQSQVKTGEISERGEIWLKGLHAFMNENFILGVGYQNFSEMLAKYYGGWHMASHNTYLSYLVDLGIAGIIYLINWIFKLYRYCRQIAFFSNSKTIYLFLLPIIICMCALDIENKIWLFGTGTMIYKYYVLTLEMHNKT